MSGFLRSSEKGGAKRDEHSEGQNWTWRKGDNVSDFLTATQREARAEAGLSIP